MLRGLIAATVGRPAVLRRVGALARGPWGWVRSVGILVGGATCLGYAPGAWAQSWEPPRERPLLLEVGAVDRTGEPRWPFGAEDVAGDGLDTFRAPERAMDFRTVYAVAGEEDLWLRAYVASTSTVGDVRLFVFVDSDRDETTGGSAEATSLDERFDGDPTDGGYDVVVAVRGDGSLEGIWQWSEDASDYEPVTDPPGVGEVGVDVDPIRIGDARRGYLQLQVPLEALGLTSACDAELFVRSLNESENLGAGDLDVGRRFRCVPHGADGARWPTEVVPRDPCSADEECPGGGLCVEGECVLPPLCREDSDCGDDERCDEGICVFDSSDVTCDDDAACGDLVCDEDAGRCSACVDDASCGAGRRCASTGRCVDGADVAPPGSGGVDDLELGEGEKIQGGAFTCGWAAPVAGWPVGLGTSLGGLGALVAWRRRKGRRRADGSPTDDDFRRDRQ